MGETTDNKNLETQTQETKVDESGVTTTENNDSKTETKVDNKTVDNKSDSKAEPKLSDKELIEQLRLDNAKQKRALDKATAEASSFKKKLREKQTNEEIEAQEKAEREAEKQEKYEAMEKELTVIKLKNAFLSLGYPDEMAQKSAEAQYEQDTDTVISIQKEWKEQIKNETKAEIIANNPEINSGEDNKKDVDPFEEGFKSV